MTRGGRRPTAVVIGGGVMGCAIAAELARSGWTMTVLERAAPGAEASSAAAGMLGAQTETRAPGPALDLALASRSLWPEFVRGLQSRTGVMVGYVTHGSLELCWTEAALQRADSRAAWMQTTGLRADLLTAEAARLLEPGLGPGLLGALHLPDDHQVEPPQLARAVVADAAFAGARFVSGESITDVAWWDGGASVTTSARVHEADHLVVAAGAWTDTLPRLAGLRRASATIQPIHGQLVELDMRRAVFRHNLIQQGGYLVPRPDGRVVVGATTEDKGFGKEVTALGLHFLLGAAMAAVPSLRDAEVVRHWSGLRPFAADGLPVIGRAAAAPSVSFASGHYRNGILLLPVTVRLVVDQLLGRAPLLPIEPYSP